MGVTVLENPLLIELSLHGAGLMLCQRLREEMCARSNREAEMEHLAHRLADFPMLAETWLIFFAAAIVSLFVQLRISRQTLSVVDFARHCFPFQHWSTPSAHMDLKIYVIRKFSDKVLGVISFATMVAVAAALSHFLSHAFPTFPAISPTVFTVGLAALALFLLNEFADYCTHYMEHKVPILWELHKVHHSAMFLSPFTATRGHPLAYIFERTFAGVLTGLAAGLMSLMLHFNLVETAFLVALSSKAASICTLDVLKHSHFAVGFGPLERILISPHMHQVHHSSHVHHWDKNFGTNLSIWDWLFGTAYKPVRNEDIRYGLGKPEEQDYNTLIGVYVGPIIKASRLIQQSTGPRSTAKTTTNNAAKTASPPLM